MRKFVSLSSALIVLIFLLEGCAPVLTSRAFQPANPHVVLRRNDTMYARSVVVKNRFLAPAVFVDDKTFSKNELEYAHTNWGHRYYVINNNMIEQIVSGKIDVFSNDFIRKQNKPWKINDSGLYSVRTVRPEFVRKLPSQEFLKPDNKTLFSLVNDYKPAYRNMQQAMLFKSYGLTTAVTTSALAGAGIVLLLLSAFDHTNPNGEVLETIGISSIASAGLIFSVAFPTFMIQYKRHRMMAIETYNRGDF